MKYFSSPFGKILKKNSEVLWLLFFFLVASYKYSLTIGIISLVILYLFLLQAVYVYSNFFGLVVAWFNGGSFTEAWRVEYGTKGALKDSVRIVSMVILTYVLSLGKLIMLGLLPAIPLSLFVVFCKTRKV